MIQLVYLTDQLHLIIVKVTKTKLKMLHKLLILKILKIKRLIILIDELFRKILIILLIKLNFLLLILTVMLQ